MYGPTKCQCGKDIGSLYALFCKKRLKKVKECIGNDVGNLSELDKQSYYRMSLNTDLNISLKDIYKELGIKKFCCIATISTTIEFKEVY